MSKVIKAQLMEFMACEPNCLRRF